MRNALCLFASAAALLSALDADAHIKMMSPTPRYADQKKGPCGRGGALDVRTSNITKLRPGQKITVTWQETVPHPGHFRIAFDPAGQNFTDPSGPNDTAPRMYVLVDNIADKTGTQVYTQEVTLPNVTCTSCTLQLMQIMTDKQANGWGNDDFYYQCADLVLAEDADMAPAGDLKPADTPDLRAAEGPDLAAEEPGGMPAGCQVGGSGTAGGAGALLATAGLLLFIQWQWQRRRRGAV
jgi:MYXO-CTERM domain-containing protein